MYFQEDQSGAVVVLECENVEVANQELSSLPLVKERLTTFELFPLVPYPGLERLFKGY